MIKKRSRQADPGVESSEDSAECCEESNTEATKCTHAAKSVNFQKLKKALKRNNGLNGKCLACTKIVQNSVDNNPEEEGAQVEPKEFPIWICLQCGIQGCGNKERMHALEHFLKDYSDPHCLMVDNLNWTVWCGVCKTEVDVVSRKKLQETVEFLKRHSRRNVHDEKSKSPQNQYRKEVVKPAEEKEKEKLPPNLPKVAGLVNLGNTCFFNAALQCLSQTPYLVKVLHDMRLPGEKFVLPGGKHKPPNAQDEVELPPIEGTLEKWGSFTASLWKMLTKMQTSTGSGPNDASELLCALKKKTAQCMDGGQHDSHELLRSLLDVVHNEDLRRYQSIILERVGLSEKTNPEGVEESVKSIVKFYGNQASSRLLGPKVVFQGVLVSTLQCLECRNTSQSTEPFLDLSLPVIVEAAESGDKSAAFKPNRWSRNLNKEVRVTFDFNRHRAQPYNQAPTGKQAKGKAGKNNGNNGNFQRGQESKDGKDCKENKRGVLQSENDADVEDNVEAESQLPVLGDVVYGPEKPSVLDAVSPVLPPDDRDEDSPTRSPRNRHGVFSPTESPASLSAEVLDICAPNSPSPTDVSMADLTRTKLDRLVGLESPENDNGEEARLSLSASLAVNSDLTSPEGPTASLSSMASKDSPTSPVSGLPDRGDVDKTDRWIGTIGRDKDVDLESTRSPEEVDDAVGREAMRPKAPVMGGGKLEAPEEFGTTDGREGPKWRKYGRYFDKNSPTGSTSGSEDSCFLWNCMVDNCEKGEKGEKGEKRVGNSVESEESSEGRAPVNSVGPAEETLADGDDFKANESPASPTESLVDSEDFKEDGYLAWLIDKNKFKDLVEGDKAEDLAEESPVGPMMGPLSKEDTEKLEKALQLEGTAVKAEVDFVDERKGGSSEAANEGGDEAACPEAPDSKASRTRSPRALNAESLPTRRKYPTSKETPTSSASSSESSFWVWTLAKQEESGANEGTEIVETARAPEASKDTATGNAESEESTPSPAPAVVDDSVETVEAAKKTGESLVDSEDSKEDEARDWTAKIFRRRGRKREELAESPTSPTEGLAVALMDGEDSKEAEFFYWIDNKATTEPNAPAEGKKTRKRPEDPVESSEACNGINGDASEESTVATGANTYQPAFNRYHPKEGECSIESCLNQFTTVEIMTGSNKIGCDVCTNREKKSKPDCKMVRTTSTKQYLISRVPAILILHLKRSQAQHVDFRKVNKHVTIPMVLDLSPNCKRPNKPKLYALYGVVEHSGTVHGGHYIAYVKSRVPLSPDDPRWAFLPSKDAKETEESPDSSDTESKSEEAAASRNCAIKPPPGKWYYTSDTRVVEVDEAEVLNSQAYLLFYERIR